VTRAGVVLAAMLAIGSSVRADTSLHWDQLLKALKGKTIEVTTIDGAVHRGHFVSSGTDTLIVKAGKKVTITRASIVSLRQETRIRGNHLGDFTDFILIVSLLDVGSLTSESFPLAVVAIPVTVAVGIVGLPVCWIWDSFGSQLRREAIVILPDPAPGASQ
jgi:hypothetical protein